MKVIIEYEDGVLPGRFSPTPQTIEELSDCIKGVIIQHLGPKPNLTVTLDLQGEQFPELYSQTFQRFLEMYAPVWAQPVVKLLNNANMRKELMSAHYKQWYQHCEIDAILECLKLGTEIREQWNLSKNAGL